MNFFYYYFYEDRGIEDPCVNLFNVLKQLQSYNLQFTKITSFHIYSHQKASRSF